MKLQIRHADVSYGADAVIEDILFEIHDKQKVAIVGRNGCGKSTFLKLITGELSPVVRDGNIQPEITGRDGITISSLSQMTFSQDSMTLGDEIRTVFRPLMEMEARLKELLEKLDAKPDEKLAGEYAALEERFAYMGGYRYEKDYELVFSRFGFTREEEDRPLSEFSGGQRTKIAFIKLLLSRPDILILDEPTNHLDISTIAWLESYLAEYPRALIVVSHDRLFLDRVAEVVYEIEHRHMKRYVGNYSDFVLQKKAAYEKQKKDYEAQQKEIARLNQVAERFIHKATKATMAKSKLKAIEHMELIEKPEEYELSAFHTLTDPARESGNDVLHVENLGIGYDTVLTRVSLDMKKGQKVGIIGGNGLGKSTFLKTLMKKIPSHGGKFSFGHGVECGYFEQQMAQYQSDRNVLMDFWDMYPTLTETEVRNILGGFLFTGEDVFKDVVMLSGGERVRLALAKLFESRPNFLLLDEPTNHMDIVGKEALEAMLRDYKGTILFVSHDRYLIRQVADALLIFRGGEVEYFPYDYEEYERTYGKERLLTAKEVWQIDGPERGDTTDVTDSSISGKNGARAAAGDAAGGVQAQVWGSSDGKPLEKGKNPGKERAKMERRIKRLEELMAECDEKAEELGGQLADPSIASDYEKLSQIQKALDENAALSDEYLTEWGELCEKLEA